MTSIPDEKKMIQRRPGGARAAPLRPVWPSREKHRTLLFLLLLIAVFASRSTSAS
jgi:hypothetical protein